MSLTVREVMQKLSKEHPDAPVKRTIERLFYVPDEDDPEDINKNTINEELTEVEQVPVESVTREINGSVVIG
jgi:hypothetical protein